MPPTTTYPRKREQATQVAVEELTGLALQERGLIALLTRQLSETPAGPARDRLDAHLRQSRQHAQAFDERVQALKTYRGAGELFAGYVRSGLAAVASVGATVGQTATLPLAKLRKGGPQERLLENAGVEGGVLANKLVILTAVSEAAALSGDRDTHVKLVRVRDEATQTWERLLQTTPKLMDDLVAARAAAA